ncbi:MAG: hypothetical protein ACXWL9_10190 [Syntrophales bacterium]
MTARQPFFGKELVVVNIGIRRFYDDLKKQKIKAAHVDWEPPAGGVTPGWLTSPMNMSKSQALSRQ